MVAAAALTEGDWARAPRQEGMSATGHEPLCHTSVAAATLASQPTPLCASRKRITMQATLALAEPPGRCGRKAGAR